MKSKLAALCTYMKGKVAVDTLDEYTYISTENMIPNKGGMNARPLSLLRSTRKHSI